MPSVRSLLNDDGSSDVQCAMEIGQRVGPETVIRTFQPSFTVTRDGVLFAFCQGRLKDGRDDDPKAILMARSEDGGRTWNTARAITPPINHFALSAYTRPDRDGETVSVLTCVCMKVTREYYENDLARMRDQTGIDLDEVGHGTACVLCRYDSSDGGETWSATPLTGDATPLGKRYDGLTPVFFNAIGQVHVMPGGSHPGRLVIAGPVYAAADGDTITDHFRNHPCAGSGVIYSDDQGLTWHMDGFIGDYLANECSAVSTGDGDELFMIRRVNPDARLQAYPPRTDFRPADGERIAHTSPDCGRTWSEPFAVPMTPLTCHGTMARIGNRLCFSIPAGKTEDGLWTRQGGTVYFSDDRGKTWRSKCYFKGNVSYSTVSRLDDDTLMAMWGGALGDKGISYRLFTNAWLES